MTAQVQAQAFTSRLPEQDRIDLILASSGKARARLIDDFCRAKLETFRSIGSLLCRKAGMDVLRHADEVTQIVAMECVKMIHEIIADPDRLAREVTSWNGRLHTRAKPAVRSYADGAASGLAASGTTALARRQREMNRTRQALRAELEREPSDVEVVETTNDRMRRLRKDPARQSMICTVEDLKPTDMVALHDDDDDEKVYEDETPALAPHEGRRMVTLLARNVEADDPVLAAVVLAWLGGVYDPEVGAPREVHEVAAHVHITSGQAAEYIARAQSLAVTFLADRFGIQDTAREKP